MPPRSRAALFALGAALLLWPWAASAQETPERTTAMTIYAEDLAAVSLSRTVGIDGGESRLAIDNLSPRIVPGSLELRGDGVTVREQRRTPWPLSRTNLLQSAVGETVSLIRTPSTAESPVVRQGRLLAVSPDIVVEVQGRIETNPPGRIALPELPPDLATSPTAVFHIASDTAGARTLKLRYLTRGLAWTADYVARWDREAGTLDLQGRARITNETAKSFSVDDVTLAAGRVATGGAPRQARTQPRALAMEAASADAGGPPVPQARADLRLYPLSGPLKIPRHGSVSRQLLDARGIAAETRYRMTGLATSRPQPPRPEMRRHARLRLLIPDTQAAGFEDALPAGQVQVYDGDVFRGAQTIPDTPLGTRLALDLGTALDVTGRAARTGYEKIGRNAHEVGRRITLRNAKAQPVSVRVVGAFQGDWEILSESAPHEIAGGGGPVWTLDVPAQGETDLTYRTRVQR
jgi:hypothetical protein